MNPTLFEIGVAVCMVTVIAALVVLFARSLAEASAGRTLLMLAHAGVDPELARHADTDPGMRDVRRRCRGCRSEDLCDRWLAGNVGGDNSFCPNAQIMRKLATTAARDAS